MPMQGQLKGKIDELITSTERAEFYKDPARLPQVQASEMVKFWEFIRPLVREAQELLAGKYVIFADAASRLVFRLPGAPGQIDFTVLNINFENPGSLTLSFSNGLGEQKWTLRMEAADSFRWKNGNNVHHIEALAEETLEWFLETTMRSLQDRNIIQRKK